MSGDAPLRPYLQCFDYVLDTVSADHDIDRLIGCLKRDGTMILVGAPPTRLGLKPFSLIRFRRTLMGSLVGGIAETQEMLEHCATHGITSDIEEIGPTRINHAYERMIQGDVNYRFVINCSQF
jgi:uncharacterized zinc-type alcohol dehydrogenase-like protein